MRSLSQFVSFVVFVFLVYFLMFGVQLPVQMIACKELSVFKMTH